jgi:hypothetical protein
MNQELETKILATIRIPKEIFESYKSKIKEYYNTHTIEEMGISALNEGLMYIEKNLSKKNASTFKLLYRNKKINKQKLKSNASKILTLACLDDLFAERNNWDEEKKGHLICGFHWSYEKSQKNIILNKHIDFNL